jgi:hypothetical protein
MGNRFPSDEQIKQDLKIVLLVFLACYGPYFVLEFARSHGMAGPLVLIPFFTAFFTGFVPMSVAMFRKMKERERIGGVR